MMLLRWATGLPLGVLLCAAPAHLYAQEETPAEQAVESEELLEDDPQNPGDLVPRAAGPFNYPSELVPSPSGDLYVSDGYRNARVHRFTRDGRLINSWGQPGKTEPGHFHLPHSILVDPEGKVYVCDRANRRVQIFSPDGEFITMWTGMGGPDNIVRDQDGIFYIAEQEDETGEPHVSIWDENGT
ncbi:hypothetical protein IIA79_07870, partial [bacterium]|nr:hypothetical protein [bacterium]